jgi:hypothetical protein
VTDIDKVLTIIALVLGILDVIPLTGPFARFSSVGLAVVLLAIVMLHEGRVLNF